MNNLLKDVLDFDEWVVETSTKLKKTRQKRDEVKEHLLIKKKRLQSELETVDERLEENDICQGELRETITNCEEMKNWLPADKAKAIIQKNRLELTMQRFKDEEKKADRILKLIVDQSGKV